MRGSGKGGEGGKDGAQVPAQLMKVIKGSVSSPATKAAESETSKNMASKTAVGVKRGLLGYYNDLTATGKSQTAALRDIEDPEEKEEAEAVLKKMKKKQKKAEAEAFPDSDDESA